MPTLTHRDDRSRKLRLLENGDMIWASDAEIDAAKPADSHLGRLLRRGFRTEFSRAEVTRIVEQDPNAVPEFERLPWPAVALALFIFAVILACVL